MSLGDRIKRYESVTRNYATPRMPLIVRVDGKAFHTFTRGLEKPFDGAMMGAMTGAAYYVATQMQGFKAAYVQSDEATFLLTDYDDINTQGWFNYNLSKIISLSAALMSVGFIREFQTDKLPVFDSRAFNVPINDVANVFLWRAQDWERNSLQMYARSVFSHRQLHKKAREDMHEMLHQEGKNWGTDLTDQEKNGTFIFNNQGGFTFHHDIPPKFQAIDEYIAPLIAVP